MTDPEIWKEAGAAGMLCLDTPSEYGGIGADFTFCAVAAEEQGPDIKFLHLPYENFALLQIFIKINDFSLLNRFMYRKL